MVDDSGGPSGGKSLDSGPVSDEQAVRGIPEIRSALETRACGSRPSAQSA
jgi:hypothetical protein